LRHIGDPVAAKLPAVFLALLEEVAPVEDDAAGRKAAAGAREAEGGEPERRFPG
jgi:hypothetical protein